MCSCRLFFFFNHTATTEIYTLSLHDALPISPDIILLQETKCTCDDFPLMEISDLGYNIATFGEKSYNGVAILSRFRSEEHTSELQSQSNLVCRLLLEKKNHTHIPCRSSDLK